MAIEIGSIGYNHSHDESFCMKRPDGPGCFLFLLVKTAARFSIAGKTFHVKKNSYVMISPHTPVYYKAETDLYKDDWFYFWMKDSDIKKLKSNGIELDCPHYIGDIDELSRIIHYISFELFSADPFHNEIKKHYTDIFFLQLGRILKKKAGISTDISRSSLDRLTYLRAQLFDDPSRFTGIDSMAEFAGLSRSGLQHIYTKTFGTTIINDVITGRIEKAKKLLTTTSMNISEIGESSGYKNDVHFLRQFKKITGLTPTEYRQSSDWVQNEKSRKKAEAK